MVVSDFAPFGFSVQYKGTAGVQELASPSKNLMTSSRPTTAANVNKRHGQSTDPDLQAVRNWLWVTVKCDCET